MTKLIPKHGGYKNLLTFQISQLIYDITVRFCDKYISKFSRTHDQMVQAARSGVQNIAEGSLASATSKKTEIKLTGVARASLGELKNDYQDYLRHRNLEQWEKDHPLCKELIAKRLKTVDEVASWIKKVHDRNGQDGQDGTYDSISANAALTYLNVVDPLLNNQIESQLKIIKYAEGISRYVYLENSSIW
ncbi:MAG: four helix bundle protein [Chlamydiae bacterium]|nr:MAG: four helix bundle protein [Chlamydiota bacterium]